MARHIDDDPIPVPNGISRRELLRRAGAAGIAMPTLAAALAACGSGAETNVGGSSTNSPGSASNKFGTGGVAGAPYPLARPEAPVTWTIQEDNKPIASGMQPESGATVQVLRWPYYLDDGVLKAFEKKYNSKVQVTEFTDMDKGLQKIATGQAPFDMLF